MFGVVRCAADLSPMSSTGSSAACPVLGDSDFCGFDSHETQDYGGESDSDSNETLYYGGAVGNEIDRGAMCSGCGECGTEIRCIGCGVAKYCSSVCQQTHLQSGHDVYCLHLQYTRKLMAQARARVHKEVGDRLHMLDTRRLGFRFRGPE